MRGLGCFLILVLLFPTLQFGLSSPVWDTAAFEAPSEVMAYDAQPRPFLNDGLDGVKILNLCPAFACEFVTIGNLGGGVVEMLNWSLTDGEGILQFREQLSLEPGETITLCTNRSMLMGISSLEPALEFDAIRVKGRFALADTGDEVILIDSNGSVVDVVVYGDSSYMGEGWNGRAVDRVPKGKMIQRVGVVDTNTSVDWQLSSPGRSSLEEVCFEAHVEPFEFPGDARMRILRELRYASSSVSIAVYQLEDAKVIGGIIDCALRGVDVRILLEGQPVGGLDDSLMASYERIVIVGGNITIFRSQDGYKRYDYLHCKYAVFDGQRSLITSENWVTAAFDSNRGWGAVVVSQGLAEYLLTLFDHDSDPRRFDLRWISPPYYPLDGRAETISEHQDPVVIERYHGHISPIISPDYSSNFLSDLIDGATERVLVQMMYCQNTWLDEPSLLTDLRSAAQRGVSVRLLFDSTWFNLQGSRNNSLVVETVNRWSIEDGTDIQARLVTRYHDFDLLHNKGLVIDDMTVITSINWCDSSLRSNREVGIVFHSPEMAETFSGWFLQDWMDDPYPPEVSVRITPSSPARGDILVLDARNSTDNAGISDYLWDIGDDGSIDYSGAVQLVQLPPGSHLIRVTVVDVFGNSASTLLEVIVREADHGEEGLGAYAPLVLLGFMPIIWMLRKRVKRK